VSARPLRLAAAPAPPGAVTPVEVSLGAPVGGGPAVCLLPVVSGSAQGRAAALLAARTADAELELVPLMLTGIGARYLAVAARRAARLGWTGAELATLVRELERHTFSLAIAPSLRALERRVSTPRRLPRGRRAGLRFAGEHWEPCPTGGEAIVRLAETGLAREATCAAALSGRPPRDVRALAGGLGELGVRLGAGGLAGDLGVRWAFEVLVAPAAGPASLSGVRERIAAAPRCGWCRKPVLGDRCRACAPGVQW
jgi:hypothetical protein